MRLDTLLPSFKLSSITEDGVGYIVESKILNDVLTNALVYLNCYVYINRLHKGGAEFLLMQSKHGYNIDILAKASFDEPTAKDLYQFVSDFVDEFKPSC
jgi:hypothetical protein